MVLVGFGFVFGFFFKFFNTNVLSRMRSTGGREFYDFRVPYVLTHYSRSGSVGDSRSSIFTCSSVNSAGRAVVTYENR